MKTHPKSKSGIACMFLAALFLCGAVFCPTVIFAQRPTVGTFYYPWFKANGFHWNGYQRAPQLGLYSSEDTQIADQHIAMSQQYGLSFFLVSFWYDPSGTGIQDYGAINYLFDRSDATGFRLSILLEPDYEITELKQSHDAGAIGDQDYWNECANWFIRRYDALDGDLHYFSRASYLRDPDGRKIISFFHFDDTNSTSQMLARVITVRPDIPASSWIWFFGANGDSGDTILNGSQLWPNKGAWAPYQPILDGGWSTTLMNYNEYSVRYNQRILTVSPSFNNTGVGGNLIVPRDDGSRLIQQLDSVKALQLPPNYLLVTSFNEWQEDSIIEPAQDQGLLYMQILKNWIDSW